VADAEFLPDLPAATCRPSGLYSMSEEKCMKFLITLPVLILLMIEHTLILRIANRQIPR
jgi:hypothetical protein